MRLSDHRIRRNPLLIILSSPAMVPGPPVTQLAPRRHLQRPCGPRGYPAASWRRDGGTGGAKMTPT